MSSLYSSPPRLHTAVEDKPSLLVCWWITLFCATIILLRVSGRFIRSERLFREDRIAGFAVIPLLMRMACVHVVLLWGTNNADFTVPLTEEEQRRKRIASGLVLASRIFYASTLWILKYAILEFFNRLTSTTWTHTHEVLLRVIRCALVATFVAVCIADLAECQPFQNYWQVLPDPGGQCRQGYAQLLTMAVCNILTDLFLVFFPVSIILTSHMTVKKKVQLVMLFSLSLAVVASTLYRVPSVIQAHGSQQLRSLLASVDLLFATTAANALVLGSFVRDRGVKKIKFRHGSTAADSLDRASDRRPTIHRHWGSDEDLVRDLGLGVKQELRDDNHIKNAKLDTSPQPSQSSGNNLTVDMSNWRFPQRQRSNAERSDDSLLSRDPSKLSRSDSFANTRRVSFFDVGGLLDTDSPGPDRESPRAQTDSLPHTAPPPSLPASTNGFRRGSQAILQELGGIFSNNNSTQTKPKPATELRPVSQQAETNGFTRHQSSPSSPRSAPTLLDVGGLLK
ncbi:uncharacterized protein B0I36DRAFT_374213 [Microdochium trichocladiopsis]|uniref:Rhodopsin domain-containing protein n=1 Tax=Microdochium trichocladiopsis TaxID=1682393 RepID=A0A9P9BU89_9PEZI|nr:uncharacterized protein B0I36DRAFT_374213 [Microdochium trichocladiopsis]KAH7031219.1 hypothetical protein B0I36DRAFT_374213 [Microdochium trichocladiopsis]